MMISVIVLMIGLLDYSSFRSAESGLTVAAFVVGATVIVIISLFVITYFVKPTGLFVANLTSRQGMI